MKTIRILFLAVTLAAFTGVASAADPVQSPRGAATQVKTVPGMTDRHGFEFHNRGMALTERKASGPANDRDLVKESRSQVYTGKNAPQRPVFEIAPVK